MVQYKGIFFPFQRGNHEFPKAAYDAELIKQSLIQIVLTPRRSRIMRPDFGCDVLGLLFEQNTDLLAEICRLEVTTAISKYEPRAIVQDVQTIRTENTLLLNIFFVVVATGTQQAVQVQFEI